MGSTAAGSALPPGPPPHSEHTQERRAAASQPGYSGPDRRSVAGSASSPERRSVSVPSPSRIPGTAQRRALGDSTPAPTNRFWPQPPRTLEEAGLTVSMVEELILKAIFFAGEMRGMDIASRI
jgi:hypothetical protein